MQKRTTEKLTIPPRKSLGQNFLTDARITRRIIEAVDLQPRDVIIEIGPGLGALTRELTQTHGVVAVEIDPRLVAELQRALPTEKLKIIEADALAIDWHRLIEEAIAFHLAVCGEHDVPRVRVTANLPYYISTPIIERLIASGLRLYDLTLMLQKEVVERIISPPGSKEYGYLSVLVQLYCETKKLFEVPPSAFRPAPKVRSAVLRLRLRDQLAVSVADARKFMKLVSVSFAQRRKTIANNLKSFASSLGGAKNIETVLQSAGIDPKRRAETLSLDEFAALYRSLFDEK